MADVVIALELGSISLGEQASLFVVEQPVVLLSTGSGIRSGFGVLTAHLSGHLLGAFPVSSRSDASCAKLRRAAVSVNVEIAPAHEGASPAGGYRAGSSSAKTPSPSSFQFWIIAIVSLGGAILLIVSMMRTTRAREAGTIGVESGGGVGHLGAWLEVGASTKSSGGSGYVERAVLIMDGALVNSQRSQQV